MAEMRNKVLRIGSRGSDLALWQAGWVKDQLDQLLPGLEVSVQVFKTTGDKLLESPLSTLGDKGLFTKELENALRDKEIDLAVHSLKDLPTNLPGGLCIGAVTRREDARDVFIPHPANPRKKLAEQAHGATIATGSLRRRSQLLNMFPSLVVVGLRGNLNTRFRKLAESDWAGMILASAGVRRLGMDRAIGDYLTLDIMLPAVGQGALAIEIREDDDKTRHLIAPLHHEETAQATDAERGLLRELEGGCQVPIGAYASVAAGVLQLRAVVASLDGSRVVRGALDGDPAHGEEVGRTLAGQLLRDGAVTILQEIRSSGVPQKS
jgi:hydroxymethylbilane synthase